VTQTPVGRQRRDLLRNRQAIIEAALDVLATNPGASMTDVARDAGLSRPTLYRHFPTREVLSEAIREEALTRAAEALATCEAGPDSDPIEALRLVVAALVPLGVRFRVLLAEGVDSDDAFLARRVEVLAPVTELLDRARQAGQLREDLVEGWPMAVFAGLLMTAVRQVGAGLLTMDEAPRLVVTTLLGGLAKGAAADMAVARLDVE
jgi:TetR/AcrR family transcriptional regulator, mexCD-oprJ operon repressor